MTLDLTADSPELQDIDWDFRDVHTTYLTHGLHPYPAKYIPQIPAALIRRLSSPGDTVADIFCGSGTTLVESLRLGRNALGIDANPLACLISRAKTTRFEQGDEDLLHSVVRRAQNLGDLISLQADEGLFHSQPFVSEATRPIHKAISFWFDPLVEEELAEALSWCMELPTETSRVVALTAFSSIIVSVSRQDSDTRYVRRHKAIPPGETLRRFTRSLRDATSAVAEFTKVVGRGPWSAIYNANIVNGLDIGEVDLVVCSPPYPNAYSYHLYHMTRMVWLGMNQPKFKREEIGSHRKYSIKGRNGATTETYRKEMEAIFRWLASRLRPKGYACFVIGDSIIRGEKVSNTDLISRVAIDHGMCEVDRFQRRLNDARKSFNPAIGKIKSEHVLILRKNAGGCV